MPIKSSDSLWKKLRQRNVPRVATVYAISSWAVIQVTSTVFPPLQVPDWVLPVLIVLVLIGFPIVLVLAWFFEFTDNAQAQSVQVFEDTEIYKPRKKIWTSNFAITILLLVVVGQFVYFNFLHDGPPVSRKSVAVLPFENLTNDPELEIFCDGINEEILNHLSKVSSINVTSRTSVRMYKGSKLSIKEIAHSLGVTDILAGTVRRSGDQVRITAQLIDAMADKTLWSEDYDYHGLKDIFPIQTDVSKRVTEVLRLKLSPMEKAALSKKYTENIGAYQLYLKGRGFWSLRTKESYDSAEVNFKKAIEIDPGYAIAYSGLADCYTFNTKGLTQVEAVPIARAYAQKALQLDSNLCEALTTIGFIQSHFDYQWEEGMETLRKALACDPNYSLAHLYLSNILVWKYGNSSGIDEMKKALELDPLSPTINWSLGRNYYSLRQYDLAIKQLTHALNLNPKWSLTRTTLADAYLNQRNYEKALQVIDGMPEAFGGNLEYRFLWMGLWYASQGKTKLALSELVKAQANYKSLSHFRIARIYLALGNLDEVFINLEKAYNLHDINLVILKDPSFDLIRNDSRYKEILVKVNFE